MLSQLFNCCSGYNTAAARLRSINLTNDDEGIAVRLNSLVQAVYQLLALQQSLGDLVELNEHVSSVVMWGDESLFTSDINLCKKCRAAVAAALQTAIYGGIFRTMSRLHVLDSTVQVQVEISNTLETKISISQKGYIKSQVMERCACVADYYVAVMSLLGYEPFTYRYGHV